jgi:hypothetical protein
VHHRQNLKNVPSSAGSRQQQHNHADRSPNDDAQERAELGAAVFVMASSEVADNPSNDCAAQESADGDGPS